MKLTKQEKIWLNLTAELGDPKEAIKKAYPFKGTKDVETRSAGYWNTILKDKMQKLGVALEDMKKDCKSTVDVVVALEQLKSIKALADARDNAVYVTKDGEEMRDWKAVIAAAVKILEFGGQGNKQAPVTNQFNYFKLVEGLKPKIDKDGKNIVEAELEDRSHRQVGVVQTDRLLPLPRPDEVPPEPSSVQNTMCGFEVREVNGGSQGSGTVLASTGQENLVNCA